MFKPLAPLEPDDTLALDAVALRQRRRFLVPVTQPLALVAQIQRSGGTLVTQLLDGHRALHVHPHELHIGKPKNSWPALDISEEPAALFAKLKEDAPDAHVRRGYSKLSHAELEGNPNHRELSLPFVFSSTLQRQLFEDILQGRRPRTQRDVIDVYATSYFNAWVDYRDLYREPLEIRYWVAFIARFFHEPEHLKRLRADYPDGRIIVPVRDPVSWYASARAHHRSYASVDVAIALWMQSNVTVLRQATEHESAFLFVSFEDLIRRTKSAVKRIEGFLGLPHDPAAFTPTFNGLPVASDSSFGAKVGIDHTALDRSMHVDKETCNTIRRATAEVYRNLIELCRLP